MSITNTTAVTGATNSSTLGMQDLFKVLIAQLSFQDPLKPMDNEQFMAQIAQFTTLEQTQEMNDKLSELLTNQVSLQSVGLIGRTVDLTTSGGTSATGSVTALSLSGTSPQLTVTVTGGQVLTGVNLSQITAVR